MKKLGVCFGSTTDDGRIRLSTLRCRESAAHASIAMLDDEHFVIEHPAELDDLLAVMM
jgi:NADH:ubiquinone oxidoreductase subunit E